MTRGERQQARAMLWQAWGNRVQIDTDADGDLWVDVHHPQGGHTFASVASLDCPLLASLTTVQPQPPRMGNRSG